MLHNTGVQMMRQNLIREFPHENREQINARLRSWMGHDGYPESDLAWFVPRPIAK